MFFYRVRYFSPALGRFIAADPVGFIAGDYNLYRYVGNQPIARIDPSGQGFVEELVGMSLKTLLTRPAALVIEIAGLLLYVTFVWACYIDVMERYPGTTSDDALFQCSVGIFYLFGWMFSLQGLILRFIEQDTGRHFP